MVAWGSNIKVTKQCLLKFSIGDYVDEIWCDVVPMNATHLILGRPWQYDRDVTHHGKLNRYSLRFKGKKYVLSPFSPSDVLKEQEKIVKFCERVSGSEVNKSKKAELKETLSEKKPNNGPLVSAIPCEKTRVQPTLYAKERDVRQAPLLNKPCILVHFQLHGFANELSFDNINDLSLPSGFLSLL